MHTSIHINENSIGTWIQKSKLRETLDKKSGKIKKQRKQRKQRLFELSQLFWIRWSEGFFLFNCGFQTIDVAWRTTSETASFHIK